MAALATAALNRVRGALCLLLLLTLAPAHARAQTPPDLVPPQFAKRELVIGTKEAPPFAMKDGSGEWHGISIDLWRRIADELHLRFQFEETDLKGLIEGVTDKRFDAGVAALTITAAREAEVDFSQPFFASGLGIAVPISEDGWWPVVCSMFSLAFVQVVLALSALLATVGFFIWLFERRHNAQFGGHMLKGLGAGFWWSAVTMTTVGYGDKAPTTMPGRLLAVAWMFASVILISTFTAGITSALTASKLTGRVQVVGDLHSVIVGAVGGSTGADYLTSEKIQFSRYEDGPAALRALEAGGIDAVVYDRPLLVWMVKQDFAKSLRVLPVKFDSQTYGIALPIGSALREPVDRALLEQIHGQWWQDLVFRFLGQRI